MALESGTFISDLVVTNPPGTDDKRQGDDHIRLVKNVLKNTFPNATKAFMLPSSATKTGNYFVVAGDQNSTIMVNNTADATLAMPALLTTDAGWMITVIKLNTGFPVFIAPPSGSIISGQAVVARARRAIPNIPFSVLWTGSNWVVGRVASGPVGSILPFFTAALPVGYEWPNGQTLLATSYPEYALLRGSGVTPDLRERALFGTVLGSTSPGLISVAVGRSGINSAVIESTGGLDVTTIAQSNLPNTTLTSSGSGGGTADAGTCSGAIVNDGNNTTTIPGNTGNTPGAAPDHAMIGSTGGSGGSFNTAVFGNVSGSTSAVGVSVSVSGSTSSMNGGVAQTNVNKMPPCATCNYALVVE